MAENKFDFYTSNHQGEEIDKAVQWIAKDIWKDKIGPVIPLENGGTNSSIGWQGLKNLFANGPTILSKDYQYGEDLPKANPDEEGNLTNPLIDGQLFFKRADGLLMIDEIFPVGSVYLTFEDVAPGFNLNWEKIGNIQTTGGATIYSWKRKEETLEEV